MGRFPPPRRVRRCILFFVLYILAVRRRLTPAMDAGRRRRNSSYGGKTPGDVVFIMVSIIFGVHPSLGINRGGPIDSHVGNGGEGCVVWCGRVVAP